MLRLPSSFKTNISVSQAILNAFRMIPASVHQISKHEDLYIFCCNVLNIPYCKGLIPHWSLLFTHLKGLLNWRRDSCKHFIFLIKLLFFTNNDP